MVLPVYLHVGFNAVVWQTSPNCGTYIPVDVRPKHPIYRKYTFKTINCTIENKTFQCKVDPKK